MVVLRLSERTRTLSVYCHHAISVLTEHMCVHAGHSATPMPSLEALCQMKVKVTSQQLNLRWRPCPV